METTGYYDNPIKILNAKISKKDAKKFMKKLVELLSEDQINDLISEIEERTVDSRFHMRLDKQELIISCSFLYLKILFFQIQ